MNIEQVTIWVNRLSNISQADIPMDIGGITLTPRELLNHAQANDAVWQKIKNAEL